MDKKFWFQLLGLVILILAATFLAFNYQFLIPLTSQIKSINQPHPNPSVSTKVLTIISGNGEQKASLDVEIADTTEKRSKGLGYRPSLATNSGMIFVHDAPSQYTYWMKGMEFPIDIIWINGDEIVDIIPNIPPPVAGQSDDTLERYAPKVEANRVLETNAGFVDEKSIAVGDKILLEE